MVSKTINAETATVSTLREVSYVEDPKWKPKDRDTLGLVTLLLLEKIPLAGIARATRVSESWLQGYVNDCDASVPQTVTVSHKAKGKLTVQMGELWSFVDNKGNKQWVWLAMDTNSREIIGCAIGDRSRESAKALWQSLPGVYRQCARSTPITGKPTSASFRANDTVRLATTVD